MKKQRQFLFSCSSSERARVRCQNCGWKRTGSTHTRSAQHTYDLAETHDCPGVETVEEMRKRGEAPDA
jgi:hypothetical protein